MAELRLLDQIEAVKSKRGSRLVSVELWPDLDRYDLRITFEDGRRWLVDVKDQEDPKKLGKEASQTRPYLRSSDLLFYVIPMHRVLPERHYQLTVEHLLKDPMQKLCRSEEEFLDLLISHARKTRQKRKVKA